MNFSNRTLTREPVLDIFRFFSPEAPAAPPAPRHTRGDAFLEPSAFFTRDCLDAAATGGAEKRGFQPERLVLRHGTATVSVTSAVFMRDYQNRLFTEKGLFHCEPCTATLRAACSSALRPETAPSNQKHRRSGEQTLTPRAGRSGATLESNPTRSWPQRLAALEQAGLWGRRSHKPTLRKAELWTPTQKMILSSPQPEGPLMTGDLLLLHNLGSADNTLTIE